MSADVPSVFAWISKRIQIWDGRQNVVVEIQKLLCGGRNTEILIDPMCFYQHLIESTYFFRILVESACFVMTIVQNYYQSLRVPEFLEL